METSLPVLANTGCLAHVADVARVQPGLALTLRAACIFRLRDMTAAVVDVCRFDQVPREARCPELSALADQLTGLYGYPGDWSMS